MLDLLRHGITGNKNTDISNDYINIRHLLEIYKNVYRLLFSFEICAINDMCNK